MVHQEVLDFIRRRRAALLTREQIEAELISGGWSSADIAEGFAAVEHTPGASAVAASIPVQPATPSTPAFASLHRAGTLLYTQMWSVVLYIFVGSFLVFAFLVSNVLTAIVLWGALVLLGVCILAVILMSRLLAILFVSFAQESRQGIGAGWKASKGRAWKIFAVTIVYLCIVAAGTTLFLLPGLVFATLFICAPYICAVEGEKQISTALWKSAAYVHRHFLKVCVRVLLLLLALYVLGWLYGAFNLYVATVFTTTAGFLVALVFELLLALCISVVALGYFFILYQDLKAAHTTPISAPNVWEKVFVWVFGIFGLICIFTVPLLLAAYNIGASRNALQDALQIENIQYVHNIPTRTFASHLFGIIFNYPASWSDATALQAATSDPTIVAYLVHNDVGGYTKRFILRKFSTQETVAQFEAGYDTAVKAQGGTLTNESTAGGTYSCVVITTIPATATSPAYQEAHEVIAFSASTFGSNGMFTIDFYDKASTYLADFAALMGPISDSMSGNVPAYIPSTHVGK